MSNLKQVKRHMGLEIWSHTNWDKSIADRVCKHSECSHWLANVKIRSCKCVGADWVPDLWTLSRLVGSRCVKSREQLVECSAPDTLSWRPPHSAPHTHTHTHTHTQPRTGRTAATTAAVAAAIPAGGRGVFAIALSLRCLSVDVTLSVFQLPPILYLFLFHTNVPT